MGFPKPLLQIGGKTFLEHILHNTFVRQEQFIKVIVTGHYQEELEPLIPDSVQVAVNQNYHSGRTGSVQTGLRALPNDISGVMIFPVDCPIIPDRVLWQIYGHWQGADTISIPSYGMKRGHPPIIGATFFPEMMRMDQDQPLRNLFGKYPDAIHHVNVDTPLILTNINTQEDYERLKDQYHTLHEA